LSSSSRSSIAESVLDDMVRASIATVAGNLTLEGTPRELIEVITLLAERGLDACQEQAPDDLTMWQLATQECQIDNGAAPSVVTLEPSSTEAKDLQEGKFIHNINEHVNEVDGTNDAATHVASTSVATFEQSLNDVKDLHEGKFKFIHSIDEEIDEKNGIHAPVTCTAPPSCATLEHSLNDVKDLHKGEIKVIPSIDEEAYEENGRNVSATWADAVDSDDSQNAWLSTPRKAAPRKCAAQRRIERRERCAKQPGKNEQSDDRQRSQAKLVLESGLNAMVSKGLMDQHLVALIMKTAEHPECDILELLSQSNLTVQGVSV
jgi:hypothetical protein